MNESTNKNGFTQVDHTTFDVILPMLSTSAQCILLRIYRQTAGWHKPFDKIAYSKFKSWTGIKQEKTIRKAINDLKELELIIVLGEERRSKNRSYGINWDTIAAYVEAD